MYNGMSDSESEYSNKFVDYLSEVAGCSKPNMVYDVGESHTMIEHEEYMDTLMHQLRGKGDGLTDPFTILENDQSNENSFKLIWKSNYLHYKFGEKYVDAAQLKECLTYYSLANAFFLWLYRSSKEMLIARCGRRPEKLKDIEKEKQRKHIKYPIGGRSEAFNCPFRCYGKMMVTESSFQKPNVGEIITAVGKDGNNHIYPIGWAVVNVENKDNWSWFLELLCEDIDMPTRNGLALISYQHK
ncbi:hypothetical protein Tco_1460065, partial [Tanacetum coccineum]